MFLTEEARPAGEPAKVGTLKLSQAMRIGAAMSSQCTGLYASAGATCAWGAAALGFGAPMDRVEFEAGILHRALVSENEFYQRVMSMNDRGMPREQIADWLESQGL